MQIFSLLNKWLGWGLWCAIFNSEVILGLQISVMVWTFPFLFLNCEIIIFRIHSFYKQWAHGYNSIKFKFQNRCGLVFIFQLLNYYIQNSNFVLFFQFCFLIIAIYLCCTTYFPVSHDTHIYWQPLPL